MILKEKISRSVYHDLPVVVLVEVEGLGKVYTVQKEDITGEIIDACPELFSSRDYKKEGDEVYLKSKTSESLSTKLYRALNRILPRVDVGILERHSIHELEEEQEQIEEIHLWRTKDGGVHTNIPHVVVYHSPDGFEWGYGGSGPADLALNILYVVTKDLELAEKLYQDYMWDVIAKIPPEGMVIKREEVREWIKQKLQENERMVSCDE